MRDRWEALAPRAQASIAFPILVVLTFLLNVGPFAQPLVRAIVYGVIEGAAFTALLVYASKVEKARRDGQER
ncbi:MAG: hypothetical protein ABR598_08040 [Candidatus Dormibacteria bacterium]